MNISMDFMAVNWMAVLAATVAGFVLGGLWYSPMLFGRLMPQMMAAVESRTGESRNIAAIFVAAFALLWAAASFLAGLLGPAASAREGMDLGLGIGLLFVFPPLAISTIFGSRPVRMIFITGGYFVVCYGLMGLILGAMH